MNEENKQPDSANSDERPERLSKNIMRPRSSFREKRDSEYEERVIEVNRVARTVAGGRRIRFRALVVIGNRKGKVGMGIAKANDVSEAVRKAVAQAKKHISIVPIINGTIPYHVTYKFGSAVVMLKPAATGTSIVAGGSVRAVAELVGITDLLGKMLGSASKVNNITATIKALSSFNAKYTKKIQDYTDRDENKAAAVPEEVVAEVKETEKTEPVEVKEESPAKVEEVEKIETVEVKEVPAEVKKADAKKPAVKKPAAKKKPVKKAV